MSNEVSIKQIRETIYKRLQNQFDPAEIDSFYQMITTSVLGKSRVELALEPHFILSNNQVEQIEQILNRLEKNEPIQYILGKTQFYGLTLNVNPNVLIPRPETEELVDWILKENLTQNPNLSLLDIGTGSGAIAISLSKNFLGEVTAFDISELALDTAQENADLNQSFVHFIEFDILNDCWEGEPFDIIVSNPPYVRELEKQEIKANVLEFEPHLALFVPDHNPLLFYDRIADFALQHLNENGKLYFEINQYLGLETCELLQKKGFKNIELKKDIYGNDRMIRATK